MPGYHAPGRWQAPSAQRARQAAARQRHPLHRNLAARARRASVNVTQTGLFSGCPSRIKRQTAPGAVVECAWSWRMATAR